MKRLLNMQQTNFMYSQSEIRVTKGNVLHFTRSRENNSVEELCILVSRYKRIILATFQQRLRMEYTSLSWYDIPELVVPITISLIEGCC
jgi:hypothetical protein